MHNNFKKIKYMTEIQNQRVNIFLIMLHKQCMNDLLNPNPMWIFFPFNITSSHLNLSCDIPVRGKLSTTHLNLAQFQQINENNGWDHCSWQRDVRSLPLSLARRFQEVPAQGSFSRNLVLTPVQGRKLNLEQSNGRF